MTLSSISQEEVPALIESLEEALAELQFNDVRNGLATDAIHELLRRLDPERWWEIEE